MVLLEWLALVAWLALVEWLALVGVPAADRVDGTAEELNALLFPCTTGDEVTL